MSVIDDIKSRIDIVEYISRDVELKAVGSTLKGMCPFPGHKERNSSFVVYPDQQNYHCFGSGCRKHGDVIQYVCDHEGVETSEAIDILCRELGIDRESRTASKRIIKRKSTARKIVTEYMHEALKNNAQAMEYLASRDVTPEDVNRWKMGIATGRMREDFQDRIDEDTLVKIGVIVKKDDGKIYDYMRSGMIATPVYNDKQKVSHWDLKVWNSDKDPYQMRSEHRDGGLFFNVKDLIDADECFIVESVWEVNQLVKRGFRAAATLGTLSEKQIKFISELRTKNPYFPELETKKTLNIWFDRDAEKKDDDGSDSGGFSGQKAAQHLASELHSLHKIVLYLCPEVGQDPDEFFREGGRISDVEKKVVHNRMTRIEMTPNGFVVHQQNKPVTISDFNMKFMYRYRDDNGDWVRMAALSRNGDEPDVVDIDKSHLYKKDSFVRWLIGKGNYNFYGGDPELAELREYLFYTDTSKEILVTPTYGNIRDDLWLFDNGAIVNGKIIRADSNRISWVHHDGIEGIKTHIPDDATDEHRRIVIPDKWDSMRKIVEGLLYFYPPYMVRQMIGYSAACVYRKQIARFYRCFPLFLLFGNTTHGKTTACNVMQSLLNASELPSDSCKTTDKAFMAHMTRFHCLPVHLSEYNDSFTPVMKNIYDLIIYSKKRRTIKDETYDPLVNSSVMFTSETTPTGQSLLNRSMIMNFNNFHQDRDTDEYDQWFNRTVVDKAGFGFLYEVLNSQAGLSIMRSITSLRRDLMQKRWSGLNQRLIHTIAVIYGGFSSIYNSFNISDLFEDVEGKLSRTMITEEIHRYLQGAQSLTEEQDTLEIFFDLFHVLYLQEKLDSFVDLLPSGHDPQEIRFQVSPVLNEVLQYDRRNRGFLAGVKRSDIEYRIREHFGVEKEQANSFTLSMEAISEDFGVSFKEMRHEKKEVSDF